jgi:hypothetical protein
MTATPYGARIGELGSAGLELHRLLAELVASCDEVLGELTKGQSPLDSIRTVGDAAGRDFRRAVHEATTRFEAAMQAARAESFRVLIREGGLSVAELSRMADLSAEMVRRLLRIAESPGVRTASP